MRRFQLPTRLFRRSPVLESPIVDSIPIWIDGKSAALPEPNNGAPAREEPDPTQEPSASGAALRSPNPLTVTTSAEAGGTVDVTSKENQGVHGLTKTTDFWFDLEISRIEKQAVEDAANWASKGLPRHDLEPEEDLPVETALAKLCVEMYRRWIEKVKTKVQDAIEEAGQRAAGAVSHFRFHLGALERVGLEMDYTDRELRDVQRENRDRHVSFGYESLLSRRMYLALVGLLVVVDWVANVPIFTELLPQEPGAMAQWRTLAAQAEKYGLWSGLYRLVARIAFSPDVTLLAFGVILFLMFLGHVLGHSVRALVAVREQDVPRARLGISAHRRQYPPSLLASAIGIVLVLGALALSRMQIERVTQQRYDGARQELLALQGALATAQQKGDAVRITTNEKQLATARTELEERQKRFDYAAGITSMNLPILLLNLVLVISAAVAAYLSAGASVTNEIITDPRQTELQDRLHHLRAEAAGHRRAMQERDLEVQNQIARLKHLLRSEPLEGWEGKAQRLRRVVPLFRAENARLRGMDSRSILAFQKEFEIDLPEIPDGRLFSEPTDLGEILRAYQQLRSEAEMIDRKTRLLRVEEAVA